ncbi:hypothetical protein CFP65_0689 [Kitasatospora sp. MMS16-BH015]|uniref:hypothetical protein n=1 Tax=Kitasatospora sp. MMS16-BH015 TaxID=2018025 RepID=UPI000CA0F811|nr:hypothetical protein [Kitasatospora sp. MMS16-BH015]AUG75641.1 hypothetical protein CFP65_0689 [Kitasatospora sp. MMS16-BH015]
MTATRAPNTRLRALLDETSWTGQQLARAVNTEGARCALALRYDRTAVAHWLGGSRPRPQVAEIVCRVLGRALGREITPEAAGLAGRPPEPRPEQSAHERLQHLGAASLVGARTLRLLAYSSVAEPFTAGGGVWGRAGGGGGDGGERSGGEPGVGGAPGVVGGVKQAARVDGGGRPGSGARQGARAGQGSGTRVGRTGTAHVRSAQLMTGLFAAADDAFGGVELRPVLSSYLATDIAVQLAAPASLTVGRRLREAAADLAYLAGFLCFDAQLHGAAQAYCRIAAELAAEDRGRVAMIERQMSVQAYYLGNHRQALQFAESAARGVGALAGESAAFVTGQLAVALAAVGERRAALAELSRAQRLLERSRTASPVLGGYHEAALAHQQAEVLVAAGDLPGACGALAASLRHRPPGERRARALTTIRLAELQLRQGHVELACVSGESFLDDHPYIRSARADEALRRLRSRLRAYQREPAARRLLRRAAGPVG